MVLPVTEDTPPDMLAGSMDLRVVLPDGHAVKMSVERSTPMMDLLVQATTLNKMTPAGHILQAMGENGILPYKPSTPIGALEAWTIHIVPKNKGQAPIMQKKAPLKPANQQQPFEQTFRLQVHLPRNQLYVMRVSSRTLLCDILHQTCSEKNLDPNKYEMRHPADLSQLLSLSCSLADYGLQEVTMVAKSKGLGQALSSSDIMALQREEDKRRQQVRQQQSSTGLSLVFNKRSRSSICEGSISSDSLGGRSISPARSDESASRSASPPAPVMAPPTRPARKRRPAPKPPVPPDGQAQKQSVEDAVNVSHSRNSSDSSGYHEASVLSDGPTDVQHIPDTLPRRTKMPAKSQAGLSRSMSNLNAATSTTSLTSSSGLKKKKAPPPPPVNKTTSLERHLSGKSSSQPVDKCSTLPGKMKMSQPEYESNSTEIPETSNHIEEKKTFSEPKLLEEKAETPPPSTYSITQTAPSLEVTSAVSQPAPSESVAAISKLAPVECVPALPELAPVESVPAMSELAPVEAVPAPVEFASPSECDEAIDQVEEAFSCVTAELDEDMNILPPPPNTIDDPADDWQYQLPAPPTAFRDSSSPTLTEGETIDLASAQVFTEPEIDLNRSVTRVNPLFIAQDYDAAVDVQQINESKNISKIAQEHVSQNNEITLHDDKNSREYGLDVIQQSNEFKFRDKNCIYDSDSMDSAIEMKEKNNKTKSRNIQKIYDDSSSMESDLDLGHQINKLNSKEFKEILNDTNYRNCNAEIKQQINKTIKIDDIVDINVGENTIRNKFNDPDLHDTRSREYTSDLRWQNNESEFREQRNIESECRNIRQQATDIRSNELTNFTISSYQRPLVTEDIYNESSDDEKANIVTKPTKLYLHQKFSSTTALNSSAANLSRTNSFSDEAAKEPTSVKRSTSHISLTLQPSCVLISNKTKSVSNLADEDKKDNGTVMKEDEHKQLLELQEQFLQLQKQLLQNSSLLEKQTSSTDTPLQSLQVLKSILPQLGQQQIRSSVDLKSSDNTQNSKNSQEKQTDFKEETQNSKNVEDRRNSNSSEVAQNSKSPEERQTNETGKQTSVVTVNNEKATEPKRYVYRGPPSVNFTTWSERPKTQVSIKMDGDYRIGVGQSNQKEVRNKTVEVEKSERNEIDAAPQIVSQVIVHKPTVNVSETKESGSSATFGILGAQHSDPSRVPIVRSVELKKSFVEQQNLHKTTTLLNGGNSNSCLASDQRNEDDDKFVGVNSLAKRFSVGVNSAKSARPVSAYGRMENAAPRKYTSVVGIGADSDISTPALTKAPAVVRVNGFTAPKHLMPVVKGFQFAAPAANREAMNKLQRSDSTSTGSKLQRTDSTSIGNMLQRSDSTSTGSKLQRTDSITTGTIQQRTNSAYTGSKLQRTDSTSVGNILQKSGSTSTGSKLQRNDSSSIGNKMQRTDLISVGKKLQQIDSTDSSVVRKSRIGQSEPPPPPPITVALKKSVTRPKTLPAANPRDQLMDAIRNFGGRENLRQYSPTQDNVMVIR